MCEANPWVPYNVRITEFFKQYPGASKPFKVGILIVPPMLPELHVHHAQFADVAHWVVRLKSDPFQQQQKLHSQPLKPILKLTIEAFAVQVENKKARVVEEAQHPTEAMPV